MKTVEVLERLLGRAQRDNDIAIQGRIVEECEQTCDEVAALRKAIAWVKVGEWANNNRGSIIKLDSGGWMVLSVDNFSAAISAASITELADKLTGRKT